MQSNLSNIAMQYHAASPKKNNSFGTKGTFSKKPPFTPLFLGSVSFRQLLCHQVTKNK
jgi:hypothetical protein